MFLLSLDRVHNANEEPRRDTETKYSIDECSDHLEMDQSDVQFGECIKTLACKGGLHKLQFVLQLSTNLDLLLVSFVVVGKLSQDKGLLTPFNHVLLKFFCEYNNTPQLVAFLIFNV